MNWFGLGINLNARDNASGVIGRVSSNFDNLENTVRRTANNVAIETDNMARAMQDKLNAHMFSGLGMQQAGSAMINTARGMLSPIIAVGKETVKTGSQFEQWRMTLKALYKDADVAKEKLNWGLKLAAKTPFEMTDVTQALIGFKAIGVDADKMFKSANGEMRSFLEYMGDLGALRPDIGLEGVMLGVRNLLGGDGGKSLRMRMDIDFEQIIGEKWAKTPDKIMQQLVKASSKLANGLMGELEGTWEQMLSNLQDQATRFYLSVADNGAFDSAKATLKYISDMFNMDNIDDSKMKRIGTNVAKAFQTIWKPIDFVVRRLADFAMTIINLADEHPKLVQLVTTLVTVVAGITALLGVITLIGGTFLVVVAGVKLFILSLRDLRSNLAFVGSSVGGVILKFNKLALLGGLAYKAWKNDFGGIRTVLSTFMSNVQTAFSYSTKIANGSSKDVADFYNQMLEKQRNGTLTFTDWLTLSLVKLQVLWMGLVDVWNDNTLSDENFQKLKTLGLLPLIELFIELKERVIAFCTGFSKGIETAFGIVVKVFSKIGEAVFNVLSFLLPVDTTFKELSEKFKTMDLTKWEKLGELVGLIGGLFLSYKITSKIAGIGKALAMLPVNGLKNVYNMFKTVGGSVLTVVRNVGSFTKSLISFPIRAISGIKDKIDTVRIGFMYAKDHASNFKNMLKEMPSKAISFIRDKVDNVKLGFMYAKDHIVNFKNMLKDMPSKAISFIRDKVDSVKLGFMYAKDHIGNFKNTIKEIPSKAISFIRDKIDSVKLGFMYAKDHIINFKNSIKDIPSKAISFIRDKVDSVKLGFMYAKDHVSNFKNTIKEIPSKAISFVRDKIDSVKLGFMYAKDHLGNFKNSIKSIPSKALDRVKNITGNVRDRFTNAKNAVVSFKDKLGLIKANTVSTLSGAFSTLGSKIGGAIGSIKTFITQTAIAKIQAGLLAVKTIAVSVAQGVANGAMAIWNFLCSLNPVTLVIAGIVALIGIIAVLWTNCEGFRNFVTAMIQGIGTVLSWLWNTILLPLLAFIAGAFLGGIVNAFMSIYNTISSAISSVVEILGGLKTTLGGIIDFVIGVFTGNWSKAWNGVKNIFSGIFQSLVGIAKAPLNMIIGLINSAISGINTMIRVVNKVPGVNIPTIGNIPKLNTGGFVKGTGMAVLHPNEVVVNDPLTRQLRKFLEGENNPQNFNGKQQQSSPMPNINISMPPSNTLGSMVTTNNIFNENSRPLDTLKVDVQLPVGAERLGTESNNYSSITNKEVVNNNLKRELVTNNISENNFNTKETTNEIAKRNIYNKVSNNPVTNNDRSNHTTSNDSNIVINFDKGAIQVNSTGDTARDTEKLFKEFVTKLKRDKTLRDVLKYK